MGEAKRRGSFDERKTEAETKLKEEQIKTETKLKEEQQAKTGTLSRHKNPMSRTKAAMLVGVAAACGILKANTSFKND